MTTYPVRTRRWTRAEYDRLIDVGILGPGDPVELLGGELMVAEPQGSRHYTSVGLVEDALRVAFGTGWVIRSQGPVALDDESEPEPDIAVVPGTRRDYGGDHPARPVLVVEVSDSSLRLDRERKGSLYARAGLDDYWDRQSRRARARDLPRAGGGSFCDVRLAVCVADHTRPRRISQPARRSDRFDRRARAPAVEALTHYCAGTGTQGSAQLGTSG
jgi:Uma2 family endonuclease